MSRSRISQLNMIFAILICLLLTASAFMLIPGAGQDASGKDVHSAPTRLEEYGVGPKVNDTDGVVYFEIDEGFEDVSGEDFLILTNHDPETDIFYDPEQNWSDPGFLWEYPHGYTKATTPLVFSVDTYPPSFVFGYATLSLNPSGEDFNYMKYQNKFGEQYFSIKVFAENLTGRSMVELRIKVNPVNDPPQYNPEGLDFYSIRLDEDSTFVGINNDHDQLDRIFVDNRDAPFDELVYTIVPMNDLAKRITVDLNGDGSNITFTPDEDWACPWVPTTNRYGGMGNNRTNARFLINCTDQSGEGLTTQRPSNPDPYFWVYVVPRNDPPEMEDIGDQYFDQDEIVDIQLNAFDKDLVQGQDLVFFTNVTEVFPDIVFNEEWSFDPETGRTTFLTDNDMVGEYPISFWVRDVRTESSPEATPYSIYMNITLHILNVNDPPEAIIDSPSSSETTYYNTTAPIEFDSSRSRDPDLIHGQVLNHTWYLDGELLGYGPDLERLIEEEGDHHLVLNVTDGELYNQTSLTIRVKKTRIFGEIFQGKDLTRDSTDNTTDPVVLYHSPDEMKIFFGGSDSVDMVEMYGRGSGNNYKVIVEFQDRLDNFIKTEYKRQEPYLRLYFMRPTFEEEPPYVEVENIAGYTFMEPSVGFQYTRLEFDLYTMEYRITASTKDVNPEIRMRDDLKSVEIVLSLAEMDRLGVNPDFELFSVAYMRTEVRDDAKTTVIKSYDSMGYGAKEPAIQAEEARENGEDGGGSALLIVLILIIILAVVLVLGVLIFVMIRKSREPEPRPEPVRDVTLDEIMEDENIQPTGLNMLGGGTQPGLPGYVPPRVPQQQGDQQGQPPIGTG